MMQIEFCWTEAKRGTERNMEILQSRMKTTTNENFLKQFLLSIL